MGEHDTPHRGGWIRKAIAVVLGFLVLLYAGAVALAYVYQTRLLFPERPVSTRKPSDVGFQFCETVTLRVGENTSEAWLLPRENARGVVLFSHGLGQTMAERLEMGKAFHDLGFDVFMYEYGGYWNSSGEPSEKRCFEDVNAAWSYLTDTKEYGANEILVFGESMGTGPSVEIAHRKRPGALVLMSPFTSLVDVAQRRMKLLPVGLLLRHRFDNAAKIRDVTCPVLIMHGVDDHEVPFAQGQRLFELANEPKTLVRMRGGHDAFWIAQEEFKDRVETFAALLFPRLAEPYAK